ncbi:hypothetical protein ED733_002700 [Metarhizium rileyi]|uniref:Uncharacterized protein n=1 Tax=Metarhizium rileyi (strain RCEF 4871) TaxID=1649241 RepID=A0A5C6G0C8_METRR|nr:hypothetical protein ED733_002700 [Metarhizium rileyi]
MSSVSVHEVVLLPTPISDLPSSTSLWKDFSSSGRSLSSNLVRTEAVAASLFNFLFLIKKLSTLLHTLPVQNRKKIFADPSHNPWRDAAYKPNNPRELSNEGASLDST